VGLDKQGKLNLLAAARGPLEHELYAAEIEVEVKEAAVKHGATGVTQEMVEGAKANRDARQAQIDAIDAKAEKANLEDDPE
jgi:hypothetical protein